MPSLSLRLLHGDIVYRRNNVLNHGLLTLSLLRAFRSVSAQTKLSAAMSSRIFFTFSASDLGTHVLIFEDSLRFLHFFHKIDKQGLPKEKNQNRLDHSKENKVWDYRVGLLISLVSRNWLKWSYPLLILIASILFRRIRVGFFVLAIFLCMAMRSVFSHLISSHQVFLPIKVGKLSEI